MTVDLSPSPFFLIGSEFGPIDGPSLPVLDPATGVAFGTVTLADAAIVDRAVRAASAAFPAWAATPATKRARLLLKLVGLIERDAAYLASVITRDNGKSRADATAELEIGRASCRERV